LVHSEGRGDELGDCVGKVALDVDFVLPSGALRNGSAARELLTQFLGRVFEINKKVSVGRDVRISYSANSAYVMYAVHFLFGKYVPLISTSGKFSNPATLVIVFFLFRLVRVMVTPLALDFFFLSSFLGSASAPVLGSVSVLPLSAGFSSPLAPLTETSAISFSSASATRLHPAFSQYSRGHVHKAQYSTTSGASVGIVLEWIRAVLRTGATSTEPGRRAECAVAGDEAVRSKP
jgi:hypothetical protein